MADQFLILISGTALWLYGNMFLLNVKLWVIYLIVIETREKKSKEAAAREFQVDTYIYIHT